MVRRPLVALLVASLTLAACSSDSKGSTPSVTICDPKGTAQPVDDMPKVGNIELAIADLEAKLGGPQDYFEVNATARLVNLFVSLNGGTVAQPWIWVDGELTSKDGQKASGGTFTAADLDYQSDEVLTKIHSQIPAAILETFYVNGDGKGAVQYGVLTSALCGGGLDVVVGPDGSVKSVDPVQ